MGRLLSGTKASSERFLVSRYQEPPGWGATGRWEQSWKLPSWWGGPRWGHCLLCLLLFLWVGVNLVHQVSARAR